MKDEIKEILDKFDKVLENYELDKKFGQMSVDSICHLFPNEMIKIKDYITNLQEELEEEKRIEQASLDTINNLQEKINQYENPDDMTLFYMWLDEKSKDKMKKLQEENKRLRKNQKLTPEQRNHLHLELDEVLEIYKSRNEKAIENIDLVIELIKQQPTEDDTWILNKLNGFKYLLQGSDKE